MNTPEDQSVTIQERLVNLIGYVEHMVRLGEKPVFTLKDYKQLAYHEATLKSRIGIRHDQSDEDGPVPDEQSPKQRDTPAQLARAAVTQLCLDPSRAHEDSRSGETNAEEDCKSAAKPHLDFRRPLGNLMTWP